jgi:hypothetical protein
MDNLSDEVLAARWLENPYYHLLCGEESFRHKALFDRSSMTRWRQHMGEERMNGLVQESLATAARPIRRTFRRRSSIRPCNPDRPDRRKADQPNPRRRIRRLLHGRPARLAPRQPETLRTSDP